MTKVRQVVGCQTVIDDTIKRSIEDKLAQNNKALDDGKPQSGEGSRSVKESINQRSRRTPSRPRTATAR